MEKSEEYFILLERYNKLKQMVLPILGEYSYELFDNNVRNYNTDKIKEAIIIALSRLSCKISTGVFYTILLEYEDIVTMDNEIARNIILNIEDKISYSAKTKVFTK